MSWSPLLPARFWVIQAPRSTRAVERYSLGVGGKPETIYTLFTPRRACFWYAHGTPSAATPQCTPEGPATYDAEVFPFLDLRNPQLAGVRRIGRAVAEGVRGRLVMTTRQGTATSTFSVGLVTAWIATASRLQLTITRSGSRCAGVSAIVTFSDW
jgi:hypothetical protein